MGSGRMAVASVVAPAVGPPARGGGRRWGSGVGLAMVGVRTPVASGARGRRGRHSGGAAGSETRRCFHLARAPGTSQSDSGDGREHECRDEQHARLRWPPSTAARSRPGSGRARSRAARCAAPRAPRRPRDDRARRFPACSPRRPGRRRRPGSVRARPPSVRRRRAAASARPLSAARAELLENTRRVRRSLGRLQCGGGLGQLLAIEIAANPLDGLLQSRRRCSLLRCRSRASSPRRSASRIALLVLLGDQLLQLAQRRRDPRVRRREPLEQFHRRRRGGRELPPRLRDHVVGELVLPEPT